jgi:hypothetical protein
MVNTTVPRPAATAASGIRWGRIVIGAVLLEAALIAAALTLLSVLANPFTPGAPGVTQDFTVFFVTVAVACTVAGALFGAWVARPLSSGFLLHGALTGIVATVIYLGICSIPPNTVATTFAAYGAFWFITSNGLRILGSTLGAAYRGRR